MIIVELQQVVGNLEGDLTAFAFLQMDALEALQFPDGTGNAGHEVVDVELHDLIGIIVTGVGDGDGGGAAVETDIAIGERGVAQATVSADGIVEAHQGGIAYISLESEQEIVYVKVVAKGRVNRFIDETHLTIDEIEKIHGKPDVAATRIDSINGFEGGYVYYQFDIDKHLNAIQYTYDVFLYLF